jgi:hypothetical protein
MGDYSVAARKAQVRLGKHVDTVDAHKYMEAAVEREIALVNYDRVTHEHLDEHGLIEDSKNLEVYQDLLRSHTAQLQFMLELSEVTSVLSEPAQALLDWAEQETSRVAAAGVDSELQSSSDELKRLVEQHDSFVRALGGANLLVVHALFKCVESVNGSIESLLARALDIWGLSEALLTELVTRNPPDEALPLFFGNKTCERLLNGYIQVHFGPWFDVCLAPLCATISADPQGYLPTRADGMSRLLSGIERAFDSIEANATKFPAFFGQVCKTLMASKNMGAVLAMMGSRIVRYCLVNSELFSSNIVRPVESVRTTLDVVGFIMWNCICDRDFVVVDAARASHLKLSVSVAHCITEHLEMLNGWRSTIRFQGIMLQLVANATSPSPASFTERLEAVSDGGCVAQLLQQCRTRIDSIGESLASTDKQAAFRLSDAIAKASVAVAIADPVRLKYLLR